MVNIRLLEKNYPQIFRPDKFDRKKFRKIVKILDVNNLAIFLNYFPNFLFFLFLDML